MIVLFHATTGQGHQKAAKAIQTALLLEGYPSPEPVDTLDLMTSPFRHLYREGYLALANRHANLLDSLYKRTDHHPGDRFSYRLRLTIGRIQSPGFLKTLDSLSPSVIACTHFLPLELLASYKSGAGSGVPVAAILTDFSPHGFWIHPHVDLYFVPNEEASAELEAQGVPANRIRIAGIPINPAFSQRLPPEKARQDLGLPETPNILILSGGFGVGRLTEVLESFRQASTRYSVTIVAGQNKTLEKTLRARSSDFSLPVTVRGYVENMDVLMDAADIVVTKPGGLTTSEVLAKARPMILMNPRGGQERRNTDFLVKQGAAIRVGDPMHTCTLVELLLNDPAQRETMARNCLRIAKPQAATLIARTLIRMDKRLGGTGCITGQSGFQTSTWEQGDASRNCSSNS
ncbi:MAG: MGDG synthase family glycosyltransferase [Leptospirales bacterium]